MAGKTNRGKNRAKSSNPKLTVSSGVVTSKDASATLGSVNDDGSPEVNGATDSKEESCKDETATAPEATSVKAEGEPRLYPVAVKTQSGEKLELQLSPGDSVMDIRQFLLDAPETCFCTCYDLVLHSKDGSAHQLGDYSEISEVADISTGGCSLEMVSALYDDRSIRSHVRRSRELLSLSNLHTSLSTSLALQHEPPHQKSGDLIKTDAAEVDSLGFMEDVTGSVCNLTMSSIKDIQCVESIIFSSFNPPPRYRRLVGDLIYIDVVTLEGNEYCISGTTKGFYVNSSTGNILDPKPAKLACESSTLVGFREVLECKGSGHPFENVQSLLPPNSWLGIHPVPEHKRDAARAEDAFAVSYGSELIGMQRDWNEELQSCREFPHKSLQERILRGRALYKVTCDFVDAATCGAIGVINRCIPPINPTDPECFHMYVHNNIFFSFAVDADIGLISKDQLSSAASKFPGHNADSKSLNNIPVNASGNSFRENCDGCSSISMSSNSNTEAQSIADGDNVAVAEVNIVDSEQATYASANNDLKGTKAYQEADVPGLYNLAMAIVDYRGHRVVAQSIIPGILQGDKSESLLYGSVDNGKKISWNESFHSKVLEAAKRLHLKEHSVFDGSGNVVKLAAPVECKGIVGSDDRHYLLDLMRVTPRDVNYTGPGSRFCVLRPELVSSFCEAESCEKSTSQSKSDAKVTSESESASEAEKPNEDADNNSYSTASVSVESHSLQQEILLNPNVFTDFKLAVMEEEIAADEAIVRKAGSYLVETVLPKFVEDLCSLELSPMDGQTLTDALHAHGINIRYLGKDQSYHQDKSYHQLSRKSGKGVQTKWTSGMSSGDVQSQHTRLNSEVLWSSIREFAKLKYKFDLPEDARLHVKKISVIRNLCQKVGLSITARKYDLDAASPFQAPDILDLQPVVKHSVPVCSEARNLIETGKARLAEGTLNEAYTLFSEAFSILQQVTGPLHREAANCCRYLAMVLYHAGDMKGAITQQHKELIINERCLGLDHPDTAHSYGNMALFYHGLNQTELALKHMSRTLLLLGLSAGPDHPDVAATFINIAMMYQDLGKMDTALRYLQEALKKNDRLLGPEHIQTAVCYHALAIAFNCMGAYKLSIQHEKKTYDILAKQLGEDDTRTRDSDNWIKTFKLREAQANAQKQKGQIGNSSSTQKAIDILKANPDLIQAFQAASIGSGGTNALSISRSLNAALAGEALPRGRGVDERAARAAAEIRKKAAARGLLTRPNGAPVQTLPWNQFLNILNNSAASSTPESAPSSQPDEAKKDASNSQNSSNAPEGDQKQQANQGPAGLGAGLTALDPKKQKERPKATKV
ncbi:Clustered mitochondria protein [Apostasia shenzhenica]|uniref:Clustered mitochondria protein n=1 Tax=Apostasia shenzhenica TaxID=1088818 RepID=A0A2I0ALW2_9ASPA|nr:Clustered mitochondria protein [Apostasia shenzhenica]